MASEAYIQHYATGGTIDSEWSPTEDTAVTGSESEVAAYLESLGELGFPSVHSETIMLKDSRQISRFDQEKVAQRVAESPHPRTLVTSGTYLMPDIGRHVSRHANRTHFSRFDRRIAITGALTPLNGFLMSDGGFNLGMAAAVLEEDTLDERILAVMNGTAVPAHDLEKDLTTSTFTSYDLAGDQLGYSRFALVPAGGSIDFELTSMDGVTPASESAIQGYLREQIRSVKSFDATPPILKDSRELSDGDIENVVEMVRESADDHILVTAGLIRMATLRRELKRGLTSKSDKEKRVVVTGSRMMLRMAGHSDAPFALGYVLGKIGFVEPGVHAAVAGRIVSARRDPIVYAYTPEEQKKLGIAA